MKKSLFNIFLSLLLAITGLVMYIMFTNSEPVISYTINENNTISISIDGFTRQYTIAISSLNTPDENLTFKDYIYGEQYPLADGNNYIYIKDKKGKVMTVDEDAVLLKMEDFKYPLYPVDDVVELNCSYISLGGLELSVSSSDESVALIKDNRIITKAKGTSTITVTLGQLSASKEIEVTDLYTKPDINSMDKPVLNKLLINDPNEAAKLDEVLRLKIEEAGYGTRAGVVAAARFLTLQFPYRIAYFSESGRLDPVNNYKVDGEGRYYHYGLYLSEDKFDSLGPSAFGRATWGEFFVQDENSDHSHDEYYLDGGLPDETLGTDLYLSKRPNGLDCSGFTSGFDFGDLGAGGPDYHGMTEHGEFVWIDDELLQSDRIRCGDYIGYAGHIGIVIGIEDNYIWIADTLVTGTKVTKYERNVESFKADYTPFEYFMLMDNEYIKDGNYTAMWEE